MAMDGSVAAEDHHNISLLDERCPLNIRGTLKREHALGDISWPEYGSGAHAQRI
jgi:hypothetical protein